MSIRAVVAWGCLLFAAILATFCRLYHLTFYPEWTEAEAFREQWPIFVVIMALTMIGLLSIPPDKPFKEKL